MLARRWLWRRQRPAYGPRPREIDVHALRRAAVIMLLNQTPGIHIEWLPGDSKLPAAQRYGVGLFYFFL
jgi:hypothetical protein